MGRLADKAMENLDTPEMQEWVKSYFAKIAAREEFVRNGSFDEEKEFAVCTKNAEWWENAVMVKAKSYSEAARMGRKKLCEKGQCSNRATVRVAENDSLDACQGHTDGYTFTYYKPKVSQ